jgi:hypothetical protein
MVARSEWKISQVDEKERIKSLLSKYFSFIVNCFMTESLVDSKGGASELPDMDSVVVFRDFKGYLRAFLLNVEIFKIS